MLNWFSASLITLICFGFWGFFSKLAVDKIDFHSALFYQCMGVLLVGFVILLILNFKPATDVKGASYAIITGIAYAIGCLFFFVAASRGRIAAVVTLTAMYPMVTLILAHFILGESISLRQVIGILLAIFAIVLMSV